MPIEHPTRADVEAFCCPASLEGGLLTLEDGTTIDLGQMVERMERLREQALVVCRCFDSDDHIDQPELVKLRELAQH